MDKFTPKFRTIIDLFETSVEKFSSNELFGDKQTGQWKWITYAEMKKRTDAFRASLAKLGVVKGDHVAIISNNRVKWAIGSFASLGLGARYVPMYESQLPKDWKYILEDCEAKVLLVATEEVYEKAKGFLDEIDSLKHIIRLYAPKEDDDSFDGMLENGRSEPMPPIKPDKDDIAFLIYTSGTTGKPKGVRLSHENIASNVSAIHEFFDMDQNDRTLSFLPWAHSFGLTCELHAFISMGGSMGLNTSVDKLLTEMPEVRPTILVSVPRIFNRIHDGVQKQMLEKPAPIRALFEGGMKAATKKNEGQPLSFVESITHSLADKLAFSKVRAKFGGRLRYAISGGAALSRDVGGFVNNLGIQVFEGYGLTETSPIISANHPGHKKLGSVGQTIPGSSVTIDREVTGDPLHGEIIAYGLNVMKGYHNRQEETEAVMLEDGGFRTGDMGYLDEEGYLYITGRIKEQYKLENGKYVVPVPLEEGLKLSMFITNVFVYGFNKPYNVALIVPDFDMLDKWAKEQGITGSHEQLCKDKKVIAKIQEEVDERSRAFKGYERVKKFALIADDFTTENGMLTPSMKLKRRVVLAKYGELVEGLYN